jgi:hypothetical protein
MCDCIGSVVNGACCSLAATLDTGNIVGPGQYIESTSGESLDLRSDTGTTLGNGATRSFHIEASQNFDTSPLYSALIKGASSLEYRSLGSPYTVGPLGVGRFQTIQSAINQAELDGASASQVALIQIVQGNYTENLTAVSGGIALVGLGGPGATVVTGTCNFSLVTPTNPNTYVFSDIKVSGLITISGNSSGTFYLITSKCFILGGILLPTSTNCRWYDYFSRIQNSSSDPFSAPAGLRNVDLLCTKLFSLSPANRAIKINCTNAMGVFGCYFYGYLETAGNGVLEAFNNFVFSTVSTILGNGFPLLVSKFTLNSFYSSAALTPVINHTGGGILAYSQNTWMGAPIAPYILNTGAGALAPGGVI